MTTAELITDNGTVRPFVVECRRGMEYWQWRDRESMGWHCTWHPVAVEFGTVKADLGLLRPVSLVIWPEQDGQRWEDA
jgi:hypothetical protein